MHSADAQIVCHGTIEIHWLVCIFPWEQLESTRGICPFDVACEDIQFSGKGIYCKMYSCFQAQRGGGGRAWFQPFAHVLNSGQIPLPPRTVDILSYNRDTNIDAKCYTVHRFS